MNILQHLRKSVIALSLVFLLFTTAACGAAVQDRTSALPGSSQTALYDQLSHGDTAKGQSFGNWVVQTSQGLIKDAYVRDNDKLGVVISSQVRPAEVKSLAKSLVQGFHQSAPNRNLTVLVYAPDKELILTARYNTLTNQVEYSS